MNLEQRLRTSLVAPDPGSAFTARVMARVVHGRVRPRRPFIVIGAVLVAGLAAAMLMWQANRSGAPAAAAAETVPMEPGVMPETSEPPVVAASGMRREDPVRTEPTPAEVEAAADPAAIRIVLMPAQHNSQDIAAMPAVDAFHAALLQALRGEPDVVVEVAGAGVATDLPANRVTVISPQFTILTSGQRVYRSGDGNGTWSGPSSSNLPTWAVEVLVEPANQKSGNRGFAATGRGGLAVQLHVGSNGIPPPGDGFIIANTIQGSAVPLAVSAALRTKCCSADQIATGLVKGLRQTLEPPATDTTHFNTRLRGASISSMDRERTISELLNRVQQGGLALDAGAIESISAYIGELPPDQRVSMWQRLRGMQQPGLVPPLIASLQRDGDERVRLEVLSILVADYVDDSRVRAALETVAREDASRFVRMAAQRPLSGDAQWRNYVLETLADKGLPPAKRIAPLSYGMRSVTGPDAAERTRALLGLEEVTSELLDIFQRLRTDTRLPATGGFAGTGGFGGGQQSQDGLMQNIVNLLFKANPAAALDLRIRILTEDPQLNSGLTNSALIALMGKRDDPRVGKVLDDIAAGKAGPQLRDQLETQMLMRKPIKEPQAPAPQTP